MSVEIFKELANKGNASEAFNMGVIEVRQVAESYEYLQKVIDAAKASQAKLAPVLLEQEVNEYFDVDKLKVVIATGRAQSTIDVEMVRKFCTPTAFNSLISVSEKAIKDGFKALEGEGFSEDAAVIVAKAKTITGTGKSSVKVSKMNATELKERAGM